MQMLELSAITALATMLAFVTIYAARAVGWAELTWTQSAWVIPALLSIGFGLYSIYTLATEGLLPLWLNHTANFWGTQVWFDLLIGFSISWVFLVTEGRRLGMSPWPWLVSLIATGNVGLLAMMSRILYLRDRTSAKEP